MSSMAKLYGKERDRDNPKKEKQIYEEKIQNEPKMKQEWKKNSMTKLYEKERDRNNGEIYKKKTQGETKMKQEWKEKITMKSIWKLNQSIVILIFIVLSSTYAYGMEANNNNRLSQLKKHIWDGYIIISLDYEDLFKLYKTCKKINELLREVLKIPLLCAQSSRNPNYRLFRDKYLMDYYHLFRQIEYLNDTFETIYMQPKNDGFNDVYLIVKPQYQHKIQSLANLEGSSSIQGSITKRGNTGNRFWYVNGNSPSRATIATTNEFQIVQNNRAVVILWPGKALMTHAFTSDGNMITFTEQGILWVVKCNYGFMGIRETSESDDVKKYHFIYWTNHVYPKSLWGQCNHCRIPISSPIPIADGENIEDIRVFETDEGFKIVLKNKILELNLKENERKETRIINEQKCIII